MKIIFKILALLQISILFISCEETTKYEGTPEFNKLAIETIIGTIATDVTFALPGQSIDFTATLPQDFVTKANSVINVEAITTTIGGSVRKGFVKFLPGQNTASGKITVGGGDGTFFMPVSLKLNAIDLDTQVVGKFYLIDSNIISIASGQTSVPADNDSKLQIKLAWESFNTGNNVRCQISRINSLALTLKGTVATSSSNVTVVGTVYPLAYTNSLEDTATAFENLYAATILANKGIIVKASGKALIFEYTSLTPPAITMSGLGVNLSGSFFAPTIFANGDEITNRTFQILNSQLSKTTATETAEAAFNPGDYKLSIDATFLETSSVNLKYRVIFKKPDGSVVTINGVYNDMTTTSGFKGIVKFNKTGLGDNAVYSNFIAL